MPAREGLVAALETAHKTRQKTLDVLQHSAAEDAKGDSVSRAYARAALREIASAR